jgi:hypothetical protein
MVMVHKGAALTKPGDRQPPRPLTRQRSGASLAFLSGPQPSKEEVHRMDATGSH